MSISMKAFLNAIKSMPENHPPSALACMFHPGNLDGKLIKKYGNIEIEDFWSSVEIFSRDILFTIWTWDDQLNVGLSYNQSYYEESDIDYILNTFFEYPCEGLGL